MSTTFTTSADWAQTLRTAGGAVATVGVEKRAFLRKLWGAGQTYPPVTPAGGGVFAQGEHGVGVAGAPKGLLQKLLGGANTRRNLNLAGLALIAAPTVHSMLNDGPEDEATKKKKHLSDLAGLGLLMGTEFLPH